VTRRNRNINPGAELTARLDGLPDKFQTIGDALKQSLQHLSSRSDSIELIVDYNAIFLLLDDQINTYFDFDTILILEILESVFKYKKEKNNQYIPTYSNKWAFRSPSIHFFKAEDKITLNFFYFNRKKDQAPHLDDYSWLVHEITHFFIEKNRSKISPQYNSIFNEIHGGFVLGSLASRSLAKEKNIVFQNQFFNYWSIPKPEESWVVGRWPLELMVDVVCLWISGPSYIKVFVEAHKEMQGFILDHSHPPVELRAAALLQFSGDLGWANEFTRDLAACVDRWQIELNGFDASKKNQYLSFKNPQLMRATREAAVEFLISLGVPQLKPQDVVRIRQAAVSSESLTATDLLVAASLMVSHFGSDDDAMAEWERSAITKFMEEDDQIEIPVTW
jgi:hypothetical protein